MKSLEMDELWILGAFAGLQGQAEQISECTKLERFTGGWGHVGAGQFLPNSLVGIVS